MRAKTREQLAIDAEFEQKRQEFYRRSRSADLGIGLHHPVRLGTKWPAKVPTTLKSPLITSSAPSSAVAPGVRSGTRRSYFNENVVFDNRRRTRSV
jgi:hypothetical protein